VAAADDAGLALEVGERLKGAKTLVGLRPLLLVLRWFLDVGERRREEAVCPVFGVAAGVGEDELDFGIAGLEAGDLVAQPAAVDVLELVQRRVPALDHNGGERRLAESLQLEGQRPLERPLARSCRLLRSTAARSSPASV
jgi:hypothetical protein